jgi:putative Mg2+ transporter-C (MgtC) family protein
VTQLVVLGRVALAMVLGGAIGFEREIIHKPAGLRTHMLVSGAAVVFVAAGLLIGRQFDEDLGPQVVRVSPVTVLEAVITGVSFLGAGTIIRDQSQRHIEGLTTAASLLFAAGVGVMVALSEYLLALGGTVLVLVTLRLLHVVDQWLIERDQDQSEIS